MFHKYVNIFMKTVMDNEKCITINKLIKLHVLGFE